MRTEQIYDPYPIAQDEDLHNKNVLSPKPK